MPRVSFETALRAAMPGVEIGDQPGSGPVPEGFTQVSARVKPVTDGVLMSVRFGDDKPHLLKFDDEGDAATFAACNASATDSPFGLVPSLPDSVRYALKTW